MKDKFSKHTPGPWRLSERSNFGNQIEGYSGKQVDLGGVHDDGYRALASYQSCCASDRYDEQQANALANARLIAAAPDLLEALAALMDMRDKCFIPNEGDWWDEQAKAAIAKARGDA